MGFVEDDHGPVGSRRDSGIPSPVSQCGGPRGLDLDDGAQDLALAGLLEGLLHPVDSDALCDERIHVRVAQPVTAFLTTTSE